MTQCPECLCLTGHEPNCPSAPSSEPTHCDCCGDYLGYHASYTCAKCEALPEPVDSFEEIAGVNDGNERYEPTAQDWAEFAAYCDEIDAKYPDEPEPEEEEDQHDLGDPVAELSRLGKELAASCLIAGVPAEQVASCGPSVRRYLEEVAA